MPVPTVQPTLHVVVVEDDPRYRNSLETLFGHAPGFHLVGSFAGASAACAAARTSAEDERAPRWQVVFMDVDLGEALDGIDAIAQVKAAQPDAAVVMLTVFEEPNTILHAICAGADGYLLKRTSAKELLEQARAIRAGGAPLTPGVARSMVELVRRLGPGRERTVKPARLELTEREREVLRCLVDGMAYKQAADSLGVQLDTVRSHVRGLYRKLQVHGAAEAVARALREQLV